MTFTVFEAQDQQAKSRFDDLELAKAQIAAADLEADEAERYRQSVLDFCNQHPDALHRSCLKGHLTGSALVIDPESGNTLLLHHAKLGRWLQPGGHADGDGNLAAVALREATEETGIAGLKIVVPAVDVDVHSIPEREAEPAHVQLDLRFLVLAPPQAEVHINHEALGARWIAPDDAEIGSSDLARAVTRAAAVARGLFGG